MIASNNGPNVYFYFLCLLHGRKNSVQELTFFFPVPPATFYFYIFGPAKKLPRWNFSRILYHTQHGRPSGRRFVKGNLGLHRRGDISQMVTAVPTRSTPQTLSEWHMTPPRRDFRIAGTVCTAAQNFRRFQDIISP